MSTLCPSAYPTILPSIHSTINQIITAHSLSGIQKISVQGLSTLSVCYFQENGCVQERAWPAWSCLYFWPPSYRSLPWKLWLMWRTLMSPQWWMGLLLCRLLTSSASFLCEKGQTFCQHLPLIWDIIHLFPSLSPSWGSLLWPLLSSSPPFLKVQEYPASMKGEFPESHWETDLLFSILWNMGIGHVG